MTRLTAAVLGLGMGDNSESARALNAAVTAADLGDFEWVQRAHPATANLPAEVHELLPNHAADWGDQWRFRFPNGWGASVCNGLLITAGAAPYELCPIAFTGGAGAGVEGNYRLAAEPLRGDLDWVIKSLSALRALHPVPLNTPTG